MSKNDVVQTKIEEALEGNTKLKREAEKLTKDSEGQINRLRRRINKKMKKW